jgi:transketolase
MNSDPLLVEYWDTPNVPLHRSMRDGFGEGSIQAALEDERVVVVCADLASSTRADAFKARFPDRFVEVGVAEQNLAGVASGLAAYGKRPAMVSFATFSPGRNLEQIRTAIALNDVPVVVCGMHAGVSVGQDGATHQALEDIALMRTLPNMTVLVPCDAEEARKAVIAAFAREKPTYIRFSRLEAPVITTQDTPFEIGRAEHFLKSESPDVAFLAAGTMVYRSLLAARALKAEGIEADVLNMHSIKPMDIPAVISAAKEAGAIVTVEEHQILGGLGSTVAEILVQNNPVPMELVGVHDRFGQSGYAEELFEEYGLAVETIKNAARRAIGRKQA